MLAQSEIFRQLLTLRFTKARTTTQGYRRNDVVRQKFTGYENHAETGLNFAQTLSVVDARTIYDSRSDSIIKHSYKPTNLEQVHLLSQ